MKNNARRYNEVSQRLQTELLVVAFVIFSEMLLSRMDLFCESGVLVGISFVLLKVGDFSFFAKKDMVDFKKDLVENVGTWILLNDCLLLSVHFSLSFCCMLFWMFLCWLFFCRWAGLKVLKFETLMFSTSILSVEIFESFTSNSCVERNITEQITRVCTLIQVRIDCIFSLLELRTMDSEFSWFTILFADMIETQNEKIARQLLNMYILWTFRNNWEDGKKLLSFKDFHCSQTATPCQAASTDTI